MAKRTPPTDFSHLGTPRAQAAGAARQMSALLHRHAGGVRVDDDADADAELEEAAKPANEREQSDSDKLVDEMRRTYNRNLGLPEDDIENGESDDSAEWPAEKDEEQARATARVTTRRGAR